MRLTTDLINNSLQYNNTLHERELDLRGHKISAIENLGAAKYIDSIDFTDNDIATLGNFPLHPRLTTLLLAQNRISTIQSSLPEAIPNLNTLVLTKNRIVELADLDPLAGFKRLQFLSLVDNPVAAKENYRLWVIWRCPSLRFLDFKKVHQTEREAATELFGTAEEPSALASKTMNIKSRTFEITAGAHNDTVVPKQKDLNLTPEERKRLQDIIKNTKSLAEITRLEKGLSEGKLPPGVILTE
ncbi:U2 small nuclear ribonucleoprotein A [Delitschia confertaspora ATCC 74209]|uniref:U2 small nuclear ribonucleoprotein A' n=1 Tax=Delitschia confertaspora ATCC 74209 TaxID=1513339 RepID=A0A9P4JUM6_9PLEO|nr:U2 small nuclear ribonucleoprotein A [Delitschia confertaspora ATCC 74209]